MKNNWRRITFTTVNDILADCKVSDFAIDMDRMCDELDEIIDAGDTPCTRGFTRVTSKIHLGEDLDWASGEITYECGGKVEKERVVYYKIN